MSSQSQSFEDESMYVSTLNALSEQQSMMSAMVTDDMTTDVGEVGEVGKVGELENDVGEVEEVGELGEVGEIGSEVEEVNMNQKKVIVVEICLTGWKATLAYAVWTGFACLGVVVAVKTLVETVSKH